MNEQPTQRTQRIFYVDASVQLTGHAAFAVLEVVQGGEDRLQVHDLPRGTVISEAEFLAVREAFAGVHRSVPAVVYCDSQAAIDRMLSDMRVQGPYAGGRFRYHRQVIWLPRCQGEQSRAVHEAALARSRYLSQEDILPLAQRRQEMVLMTVDRLGQQLLAGLVIGSSSSHAQVLPISDPATLGRIGVQLADLLGVGEVLDEGALRVRLDSSIRPSVLDRMSISSARERLLAEAAFPGDVLPGERQAVAAIFS